jgi:citrate lyase synthetase
LVIKSKQLNRDIDNKAEHVFVIILSLVGKTINLLISNTTFTNYFIEDQYAVLGFKKESFKVKMTLEL